MLVDMVTARDVATGLLVPMQDREPPPGQLPEFGNAAPVGLAIVLVLLLATIFLIRNMSKRITRLPESFGAPSTGSDGAGTPAADDASQGDALQDRQSGGPGSEAGDGTGRAGAGDGRESRSS
ncbi:hypothetical protein SAMN05216207_1005205 [Pseudonocardia ammonioxydans]|uniref:Uncharacterized protein n=2 Tax=Pseudonocardia ammonioxydans TaxID=260086 RepID=A0A1I4V6N7_PSUAM|nr:hypothetical protein SAMN05216207_1005205 [Pseudonocardia ammonioxydans]